MSTRQYQGSQGHLLDLLDRDDWWKVLMSLVSCRGVRLDPDKSIRTPIGTIKPKEWSIVQFCHEYCSEEMGDGLTRLSDWWVKAGTQPTWDLIVKCLVDGAPGILLVEAKAHVKEMHDEGKQISIKGLSGSPRDISARIAQKHINHGYIGRCIHEARDALRKDLPKISIDRDKTYQLSNRIATAWKLAECNMPTVLLYLGFTGDAGLGEPLLDDAHWRDVVHKHLKIVGANDLPDADIWLTNGCPLRFCIGSLPAHRQSESRRKRV